MHKVLIISGTNIISGAEYVLGDYLNKTTFVNQFEIICSDNQEVKNFYKKFNIANLHESKFLNPVSALNNKVNLIKKFKNFLFAFFTFNKILTNKDIKIVLGNNTGDIIYSLYSKKFGKIHFNYIHDIVEENSFISKVILFFDKYVEKYIVVSNAVKNSLINIGVNEEKIEIIYNGIEYNENYLKKTINDTIVFGFVGNIEDRKNPLEFIEIVKKAKEVLPFEIEGRMVYGNILDNSLFNRLKKTIKENKLNIKLIGKIEREKMKNFYDEINFLVLTSKKDPLPTVILESFNHGVPVIAKDVDGVPEMVIHKKNGFLYDKVENINDILIELLNCNYSLLQQNANLLVKDKFNIKNKIEKLDNLLFKGMF